MKRGVAFVLLVVVIDFGLGAVFERLFQRTLTGERGGLTNYALLKDADVLVLGSSRAQLQVMPSVLESELSLRTFNAGLKGYDALYAVMLADLWKRRHPPPRAIVLTVDLDSLLRREGEIAGAQILAPYIDESDVVRHILYLGGPYKRLEYLSRAYRYNGKVLSIAKNLFVHPSMDADGFWPAVGTMVVDDPGYGLPRHGLLDYPPGEQPSDAMAVDVARQPFWQEKLDSLRDLASSGQKNGTRLFLVHTPIFGLSREAHDIWAARVAELASSLPATEFLDICEVTHPTEFSDKPELFKDFAHLNPEGAKLFSGILATELKRRMGSPLR